MQNKENNTLKGKAVVKIAKEFEKQSGLKVGSVSTDTGDKYDIWVLDDSNKHIQGPIPEWARQDEQVLYLNSDEFEIHIKAGEISSLYTSKDCYKKKEEIIEIVKSIISKI